MTMGWKDRHPLKAVAEAARRGNSEGRLSTFAGGKTEIAASYGSIRGRISLVGERPRQDCRDEIAKAMDEAGRNMLASAVGRPPTAEELTQARARQQGGDQPTCLPSSTSAQSRPVAAGPTQSVSVDGEVSIRALILEFVDANGASHIRELHIEVLRSRPGTPEHTIRARLSEAADDGLLSRLGDGFYDVYAEEEEMTSVVSYPDRCSLWGDSRYRGNCDGRLFKNLVLRYRARRVADPMLGSGTTRDVIEGLNKYKHAGIQYWGGDLHNGFDLTAQELPGRFDFAWIHPPYWNIVRYGSGPNDLSSCGSYEQFRKLLMLCLKRCYDALEPGGRLAVLMGDVRRNGQYTPIIKDILNFPHGELRSIIIKAQHNCMSDRKAYGKLEDPPIKHEYCCVFKKTLT
jgi:hypothetical protein